jgi:hypothetical protein
MTRQECLDGCTQKIETPGKANCAPFAGSPAGEACEKNVVALATACRNNCPAK